MSLDFSALRAATPGCATGLNHLNNAGAGLMPSPVLNALKAHLDREAEIGGYEAKAEAAAPMRALYDSAARLIGGKPHEIAYMENATRAWDAVFYAFDWKAGDKVVTVRSEYNSNMIAMRHAAERFGIEIILADDGADGAVDVAALAAALDPKVRLIAVSHMPTNDGLINDAARIGDVATRSGIPFLLDACQSVGHMPVDVTKLGCTMLSATGRKYLRGPRGTGFLWVREDWIERLNPPFLDNHAATWTGIETFKVQDSALRFENWESYFAGRLGLAAAIDYAMETGIAAIWERIQMLSTRLRAGLDDIPGVTLRDHGTRKSGIVLFTKEGAAANDLSRRLRDRHRINTSVSEAQLTRDDQRGTGVFEMVRASPHAYNTEAEVDALLNAVADS